VGPRAGLDAGGEEVIRGEKLKINLSAKMSRSVRFLHSSFV